MEKIIEIVENKYPWSSDLIERLQKHSPWTYLHSLRVAKIAYILGQDLKLAENELDILAASGILHDVGKLYVDNKILNSDQFLTTNELESLRDHSRKGYEILKEHNEQISKIVVAHHEHQDNPYPRKDRRVIDKNHIDLERIIALSDTVDSAMSDRPYKKAKTKEEAFVSLSPNFNTELIQKAIQIREII
jgi:putative nucleotidyltransferase with HDIG domain